MTQEPEYIFTNPQAVGRYDYWLSRARNEFPRVGSLYRVKENKNIFLNTPQKEIAALHGAILMLAWVECPYEWAAKQVKDEKLYFSSIAENIAYGDDGSFKTQGLYGFSYKVLWQEKLWNARTCILGSWDSMFERIETKL